MAPLRRSRRRPRLALRRLAARKKIAAALVEMEAKGDLGLRRMLFQLHTERARLREAALRKLILEGGGVADSSPTAIAKSGRNDR